MKHTLIYIFVIVALFSFIAFVSIDTSSAREYKKRPIINQTINLTSDKAIADAMSVSAIDCSSTKDYQAGVGLGAYGNSNSAAIGACSRFDNVRLKITGHERGGNIGLMFTFK